MCFQWRLVHSCYFTDYTNKYFDVQTELVALVQLFLFSIEIYKLRYCKYKYIIAFNIIWVIFYISVHDSVHKWKRPLVSTGFTKHKFLLYSLVSNMYKNVHLSGLNFEDTKGVIRSRISKTNRKYNGQKENENKRQAMIYKILHKNKRFSSTKLTK